MESLGTEAKGGKVLFTFLPSYLLTFLPFYLLTLLPILEAYFLSAIGDETALTDGIEAAKPAFLEDLLTRVLGDDAWGVLLAACLDALEKLLRVLGVEGSEGLLSYYTIGGYAQH